MTAYLLGLDESRISGDRQVLGPLLEGFVLAELVKQIGWSHARPNVLHLRSQDGVEVDIVLEHRDGRLVAIEVKAAATVSGRDFRGIRALSEAVRRRFHRGVVLYSGGGVVPFGERTHAVPVDTLWRSASPIFRE